LITEFFKNGKIIRANVTSTTAASRTEWEVAKTVFDRARADTIIVESSLRDEFMKRGLATKQLTPLGSYILSDFESLRHDLTKQLVFDHNSIDKFNEMLSRLTRYSKRLKFYDKQIGTGEGLSNFFKGIGHILDRWLSAAHFPKSLLSIEVYTVHKQSQKDASTRHSLVFKNLACRLANEYGIKTSLHFKKDDPTMIHDRYLETDSVAVEVGRGFDLFRNGVLQTCSVSLSNSYFSHLNDWRNLADLEPTREIAPH
jgi:hypothetical protein